ncbi:Putative fatty acyl-CoA reductase [Habropoda laboriosa]|uniref:Fatty acyl-CoA reductase n=1 Tax=Habropoda laboriosa TaxID=597456 RepID=A0A0L7QIY6_9HYME|nr:PREDICTED: putative fatty acyl-CoA reductase CG5065 [Habropoda laboriosa]KOC58593.1 Putative fatty acyl-CoA reductase [Habropoda laboriosa]
MNNIHETYQLDENENLKYNDVSQIRKFYAGKCILLTGCIGFLGSVILEKLLRTCVEIDKIYVMIRTKRDVSIEGRLKKRFENVLFRKLHELNPNFMEKVVPINGDLQKTDLGLSPKDRRCLIENVDIIIHNASVVYFEARPSYLLRSNVIGTQKMLELAAECNHLKAFVYVSTAYSHLYNEVIEEKFYPPPADIKLVEEMIRADEETKNGISKKQINDFVGKWNNMYTFSKAITESMVKDFSRTASFPCLVFRPSIVVPPYLEPLPGWVGNRNGPITLSIGMHLGLVHVIQTLEDTLFDIIPVDIVTNSLLALIWDSTVHRKSKEPQVYNCASSDWNPFTYALAIETARTTTYKYPTLQMVWYPFLVFVPNFGALIVLHLIFHVIPAIMADIVLVALRKKPLGISAVWKVTKNLRVLSRFTTTSWIIKSDNIRDVQTRMNAADLKEFPFDLKTVDWFRFLDAYTQVFLQMSKETPESLPAARKKYRRLMILHYTICSFLVFFLFFFLFRAMCNVFNY